MAKNLGTYPLQDQIVDLNTGRMSAAFERTFRDMWTQINGAAKVVGSFVAQGDNVAIKANTLNLGSHIDIVAEYGDVLAAGNISVHFGLVQLCAVPFAGLINGKMTIRASIIMGAGVNGCFSTFTSTDSGGNGAMGVAAFTAPDLTKDITVSIDHGNTSNMIAVKTYT